MASDKKWNESSGWEISYIAEKGHVEKLQLPVQGEGKYRFSEDGADGIKELLYFERNSDGWFVRSMSPVFLKEGDSRTTAVSLRSQSMIHAVRGSAFAFLFVRETLVRDSVLHNYAMDSPSVITIGRTEKNGLQYSCGFVSANHAIIQYQQGKWQITDNNSTNGTFVNGRRIKEKQLKLGDTVDIYGLKLIIGAGYIAVNDLDERTRIRTGQMKPLTSTMINSVLASPADHKDKHEEAFFNRSPRRRLALVPAEISIEAPPPSLKSDEIPLLLRMGGSAGGMLTSMMMGNFLTVISSLLFPFLNRGYTEKQKQEYEQKRIKVYTDYLKNKASEISKEADKEALILNKNYPDLATILTYSDATAHLWERRFRDDDFLTVRLGIGRIPIMARIDHPRDVFSLEKDPLEQAMLSLAQTPVYLENVPILHSFTEHFVTGVTGKELQRKNFFYHILMQLVMLHSYDEVKTVFLVSPEDIEEMSFIRCLPHAWNDQKTIRFIAATESEAFHIGEYLKEQLGENLEEETDIARILQKRPYYMVFALNRKLLESMEVLKEVMALPVSVGISVLTLYSEVPKDSSVVFELHTSGDHKMIHVREIEKEDQFFRLDDYDPAYAGSAFKRISNLSLKTVTVSSALPRMLTFLEMFHVGKIENLHIQKRWKENNPIKTLAVPVGVSVDGTDFMLDLHEKYQGPHGLVAGTTGSGKSEFLLTYILSLAVNFHPDEVSFVLIDYKGGGLAGAFDDPKNGIRLPHLAGTITNLDGSAISRSLTSLHSEMTRRQRIFNDAKSDTGEGTMDIYTYQRLYRAGKVKEPMPHLFIISDEFAELKQQQPEFLSELVSIARIGRSLGVHLILATQKPGGVVTDQIFSNSKFRVCLKVQDKTDSMELLKRPEAVDIRETGRFYLQVGNNELFVMGQSAWSGAAYEPQETLVTRQDDSLQFIDRLGGTVLEVKPEVEKFSTGRSQLVEVVQEIIRSAEDAGFKNRSLWLPPLPELIDAGELENAESSGQKGLLSYCAGLLDDPEKQAQYPLILSLEHSGHMLVMGEQGCGKTTFIQTMLSILSEKYPPEELNYYILDYSSRLFRLYDKLPHCGGVLMEEDEEDINAFFQMIRDIINVRKKQFAALEVDSYENARKHIQIPYILVVIDNLTGLRMSKNGQAHFENLPAYLKMAANYGVCFVISASHLNDIPSRIRQELSEKIVLQMKDRYEYYDALGIRVNYVPAQKNGRGLYSLEGRPLEMQLSMVGASLPEEERIPRLKDRIQKITETWRNHVSARRLPKIPEEESFESFAEKCKTASLPLGYALPGGKPVSLPFKQLSKLSVYFGNPDSITPFFNNMLYTARQQGAAVVFAKRQNNSCFDRLKYTEGVEAFGCTEEEYENFMIRISNEMKERYPAFEKCCLEQGHDPMKDEADPEIFDSVFDYMKEHVKPTFVFLEDVEDFCRSAELKQILVTNLGTALKLGRWFMIYFIAGYYPDRSQNLGKYQLSKLLEMDRMILFLGGSMKRQTIAALPYGVDVSDKPTACDRCVMKYREEYHTLQIPMEKIQEEISWEDRSIFSEG